MGKDWRFGKKARRYISTPIKKKKDKLSNFLKKNKGLNENRDAQVSKNVIKYFTIVFFFLKIIFLDKFELILKMYILEQFRNYSF